MEQNLAKGLLVKKNILLYLIPHFYGKQNETTRKVGDFIIRNDKSCGGQYSVSLMSVQPLEAVV